MKHLLNVAWKLQYDNPSMVLCGSIGLWLHGMELNRPLSDLDFTVPKLIEMPGISGHLEIMESADMDLRWREKGIACELQVDPSIRSVIICHDGREYKVATFMHMYRWKREYARRGYEKHIKDLKIINACLRQKPFSS